ncbi:MAG TPA: hypothetical protein VFJ85_19230 [Acidimicrobiales bacterium]|nr:hypothetical protein [Acidimicrobiales bacterium]
MATTHPSHDDGGPNPVEVLADLLLPRGGDQAMRRLSTAERVVRAAVVAVVVAKVIDDTVYAWHQFRHRTAAWWAGVEQREDSRFHEAELRYLADHLSRPH